MANLGDHNSRIRAVLSRAFSDYGMVLVLLLLCGFYSWVTLDEQHPVGEAGARALTREILQHYQPPASVLIVGRSIPEDVQFTDALEAGLRRAGFSVEATVRGQPSEARRELERISREGTTLDLIAGNHVTANWAVFGDLKTAFPNLAGARLVMPGSYRWPNFLKADNLLNVADQIAVIAILAIGMTLVILTGGIDLSVGSLIALSAVVTALLIRDVAGAEQASVTGMTLASAGGIAVCALMGLLSGLMVTVFAVPPFIATLGMMLVASGLAYLLPQGQAVYQVPASFVWLGRGSSVLGIPNAVFLALVLYVFTHLLMSRTTLGRRIYAIGGNREAARYSGVPVKRVLLIVYTACGAMAGLGGVVTASQLKCGSPTYGRLYELYVITAVVVGGTSLSGGQGRILGTLVGALIIAVIQNGMNLTGVESYTQSVVLGVVILGAVLFDNLKRRGFQLRRRRG